MKTILSTFVFVHVLAIATLGQSKTYLGADVAIAYDLYDITDNGNYLQNVRLPNIVASINIRQEIKKTFFVEVGLMVKEYQDGFGFRTIPTYGAGSSDHSWLIQSRLGLTLNILKQKLFLVPVVGYTYGINPPFGEGFGYGTASSSTTVITYDYTESPEVQQRFLLLQTGIGIEWKPVDWMIVNFSVNNYHGFEKTTQLEISYSVNGGVENTGRAVSKGQFWCIGGGVKYPISNLWK